jgi:hypothetical protein
LGNLSLIGIETQYEKPIIVSDAETEDEREQQAEEHERRRWGAAQRVQRILKNFVRRYLRGLRSPDFQEMAGYEVTTQNYIVFSHLLWRLFAKGWVDSEFIIDALLKTWIFFWGNDTKAGYYQELEKDQQTQALRWLQEHHADAEFIAALAYCAYLTDLERWHELRFSLRNFWRVMLPQLPFKVTAKTVEEIWRIMADLIPYESPSPSRIVNDLAKLAHFETEHSFLREMEARYEYPPYSCAFEEVKVHRPSVGMEVTVECLVLCAEKALSDKETAISILQDCMHVKDLDYYRLASPDHNGSARMLLYDVTDKMGIYWARDRGEDAVDFGQISVEPLSWEISLEKMELLANKVDASLVLTNIRADVSA